MEQRRSFVLEWSGVVVDRRNVRLWAGLARRWSVCEGELLREGGGTCGDDNGVSR